jgi:hypothetical protein
MSFFGNLFRNKKKAESVVLVDIGADSVAGAYVRYAPGELPALLYTRRLPVEAREGERRERAMARALGILGEALIREGAPALARATGKGNADEVLVSIDAPWQKTMVRTENLEQETPFVFTRGLVDALVKKADTKETQGDLLADESVIGTILNGYETRAPYGKKAHRADVILLTSTIDEPVARHVVAALRGLYHTRHIAPIAASSLRYQALRKAFPHERDALILDALGPLTSIALVRRNLLVALAEVSGTHTDNPRASNSRAEQIANELAELAKRYPLPRTIFLLARESDAVFLRTDLAEANFGRLWLSNSPPQIVLVLPSAIVPLVRQVSAASPDLPLLLMALYRRRASEESVHTKTVHSTS